jgi:hypothetical protein
MFTDIFTHLTWRNARKLVKEQQETNRILRGEPAPVKPVKGKVTLSSRGWAVLWATLTVAALLSIPQAPGVSIGVALATGAVTVWQWRKGGKS